MLKKPAAHVLMLVVLSGFLFFFKSGEMPLTDPDETFYAQTAKEMLERREWSTPYIFGKPQFEKPILFYWCVEASYRIFGVNEAAARLPSAVFGLIGLVATYLLGSLLVSRRCGLLSALILATCIEYIVLSRACVTDMALGTFFALGIFFFLLGHIRRRPLYYVLSSAVFALATLTKGPIGILLPAVMIAIYLFAVRDFSIFRRPLVLVSCILVFLAVSLPWYIVMYKLHGKTFIDEFFGFHNVTRFLVPEHKIGSQFYYYIPLLFGGFFPWSVFLPFAAWHALKKRLFFLLIWFAVIFGFFSASSTKLPTYIFPCFSALALMAGAAWDDFLKGPDRSAVGSGMKISYYLLMATALVGGIAIAVYIKFDYPSILRGVVVSILVLLCGFAFSLANFMKRKYAASFACIILSVILFLCPFSKLVIPEIGRRETSREISAELLKLMKPQEELGSESRYTAGLAFYTGKFPVDVDKHHILVKFMTSDRRVWCVLKEKNHIQLYELDTKPYYTRPSWMVYSVGKRAIVTNRIPEDGKFIIMRERKR